MEKYVADTHIHTKYSFDSKMEISDIITEAEKLGLKYIALTDHIELSNQPVKEVVHRIGMRNKEIDELQSTTKIKLIKGIEISEPHHFTNEMENIKEIEGIDYILGSVHHIFGMPIKKMRSYKNAYDLYLKSILEMVETASIDTVAHLDYLKRHITSGEFNQELLKTVLEVIIERDLALEINTSGFRRCNEYFPSQEILSLYQSMGGKKITYGSDAHRIQELYDHIEEASTENTHEGLTPGVVIKRRFRNI